MFDEIETIMEDKEPSIFVVALVLFLLAMSPITSLIKKYPTTNYPHNSQSLPMMMVFLFANLSLKSADYVKNVAQLKKLI